MGGTVQLNSFSKSEKLISPDEEIKILESLEQEFFNPSLNLSENIQYEFHKKWILIPATIWLICILLSLGTVIVVGKIKPSDNTGSNNNVTQLSTINNSILSTYKVVAEEEIKQKTEEVRFFQNKLEEYDSKLHSLRNLMNENLENTMTRKEIETEIAQIEQEKENVNLQMEKKIQEINKLNEDSSQYDINDTLQEFERFQKLINNQSLISDQISSVYSLTFSSMNSLKFEQAKENIISLKTLINSDLLLDYPSIQKRKEMNLEIIRFIETHIDMTLLNIEKTSEVLKPDYVSRAEIIIKNADSLLKNDEITTAIEFYQQGLETIPFINTAKNQLKILDEEEKRYEFNLIISSAQESYSRGNLAEASMKYEEALLSLINYKSINVKPALINLININSEKATSDSIPPIEKSDIEVSKEMESENPIIQDSKYDLLGIVSAINGDIVSIEILKNLSLHENNNISIRRYYSAGKEEIISEGFILSISDNKVTAKIREESQLKEIMIGQDIVYLESPVK